MDGAYGSPGRASTLVSTIGAASREGGDTITDKAARVLGMAREVRDRADSIRRRCCRPLPEKAEANIAPPSPDHVVFSLEAAEHELDAAIRLLGEAQNAL